MARAMDADLRWALEHVSEQAELSSDINGADDPATRDDRRLEVVMRRLAREAGYDLNT